MLRLRTLIIALSILPAFGCANVGYYAQAINGQFEVYSHTRLIDDVIADPGTDSTLKDKLAQIERIREYASRELGLPDNDSYRVYADLKRPYVLWNVFATPEFSLKPTEWCFIVTGCVAYRGYFSKQDAENFATQLRAEGADVYVGGVTAYSTLGWFKDPLLNTVVNRPLPEIAGLIFHELAHQRLYVRGDTSFSESFAMTVELEGVRRWLKTNGTDRDYEKYQAQLRRRQEFAALIAKHRDRLEALYESGAGIAEKRAGKAQIFAELRAEYEQLKASWNGYRGYDGWFAHGLNNAHLISLGMYFRHVPAFEALLARNRGNLIAFYQAAEDLGHMPSVERVAALNAFLPTATLDPAF
ncbi:MAG: aminopeptidase [Sulfurifustaceae bacterium]